MELSRSSDPCSNWDEVSHTVVPLVVQQIKDYPDDTVQLWGIEVDIVTIVGVVRAVMRLHDSKLIYTLEDHTGTIRCVRWIYPGLEKEQPKVAVDCYSQVFGSVRRIQNIRCVLVYRMTPCRSFNEVTTHLLEVLNARYRAEKTNAQDRDLVRLPFVRTDRRYPDNWNAKQKLVYDEIRECPFAEGISVQLLLRLIPSIGYLELREIIDVMCREGHIFTTVDAYHFLTTQ